MRGIIKKYTKRNCKTSAGVPFSMLDVEVNVVNENKEVRTYRGSLSFDFAKRYFQAYGKKTSETIGDECEITLVKTQYEKDGETRTATKIKYFNLLNDDGTPFILRREDKDSEIDF